MFMRVLKPGSSSFYKIDPKEGKKKKIRVKTKNKQENPLFLANTFFNTKKEPEEVFPYGDYTTKTIFWVAGS